MGPGSFPLDVWTRCFRHGFSFLFRVITFGTPAFPHFVYRRTYSFFVFPGGPHSRESAPCVLCLLNGLELRSYGVGRLSPGFFSAIIVFSPCCGAALFSSVTGSFLFTFPYPAVFFAASLFEFSPSRHVAVWCWLSGGESYSFLVCCSVPE